MLSCARIDFKSEDYNQYYRILLLHRPVLNLQFGNLKTYNINLYWQVLDQNFKKYFIETETIETLL